MASIVLEGVTKRFGSFTALDSAHLTIESGSFTSIFGPPGSGKSVLLRLLLGLDTVDEGRILIDGQDVTRLQPKERDFAMVFQNLALFPQLNARDNIAFPLVRRGLDSQTIGERLERVAAVLSIAHILHKKPASLSGGERQRVAIGRALVRDATAYLMDEPIAALDARLRDTMRVELKRLQAEFGHTFIYVTHDNEEAMAVADRMAILEDGRIKQIDRPDTVYSTPSSLSVAELVGSPKINVLPAEVVGGRLHCALGALELTQKQRELVMGQSHVTVGIRPEAIRLAGPENGDAQAAAVSDVERLGGFSIVTAAIDGTQISAIADTNPSVAVGDPISIGLSVADCHFFDSQTGARIV